MGDGPALPGPFLPALNSAPHVSSLPLPSCLPATSHQHVTGTWEQRTQPAGAHGGWPSGGGHSRNLPLWYEFFHCSPASLVAQGSPVT